MPPLIYTAMIDLIMGSLGIIASTAGVVIGLYTLQKVRSVESAQSETSKVTQKLLGVDNIESDYTKMIVFLSQIKTPELKTTQLLMELNQRLGSIQGIRRTLSASGLGDESKMVALQKGFFCQEFLIENIDRSTSCIEILTGRSKLISAFSIMEQLRIACESGVKVRLITLCENADTITIEDALQTVAYPAPKNAEDYREQLRRCTKDIRETVLEWDENTRKNFQYRTCQSVPRISSVRTDDYINLGFLQLYRDAQPKNTSEREYIKISTSSDTGKVLLRHFECVWDSNGNTTICNGDDASALPSDNTNIGLDESGKNDKTST